MRPVCLVQPPVSLGNRSPCLEDQHFGLGLLALSAYLQQAGVPTVGLHLPGALRHGFTLDEMVGLLRGHNPLVVALGLNWVHFSRGVLEVAAVARQALPTAAIVVGGQHATLFAAEIAAAYGDLIDAVVVGEAERPLLDLYRSLSETGRIDPAIPGLCQPGGQVTPPRVVAAVDDLPLYSYHALRPRQRPEGIAAISTGRGPCPFQCAYCIEPVVGRLQGRSRLDFHAAERTAAQIARLAAEGIETFTIQDAFFAGGDALLIELAAALAAHDLRPGHLNVFAHPDSYGPDGLAALAGAARTASIDFGVETGSPAVARAAARPMDPGRVVTAIEQAVAAGVIPYTWWLAGLPGSDAAAQAETRALVLATMRAGGVPRWVSPLILFPQTAMARAAGAYGVQPHFRSFADFMAFSDTPLGVALHFPDLITHATVVADREAILDEALQLRRFILQHFDVLEEVWRRRPEPRPDLAALRGSIARSFF